MPGRTQHEWFDEFLAKNNVLLPGGKYGKVHEFMDAGVKYYGGRHRELDIFHDMEGIRNWLNGKFNVIGQDLATDWLRACLGHLCLDEKENEYEDDDTCYYEDGSDCLFKAAYQLMKDRGWTKAYFKRRK